MQILIILLVHYLNKYEIKDLLDQIPNNILVVIDTAYAEYVDAEDYDANFSLVERISECFITRTFSKAYGLAGLSLGWCYGSKVASN